MGSISSYSAATGVTNDDVLLGNDGSTTKKFPASVLRRYMNQQVFNVADYGAFPDNGATNATTGIQAAVNAAAANGGGIVWCPPSANSYIPFSKITVSTPNITVMGVGSDNNHNVGSTYADASTKFYANFADYIVDFASPVSGGSTDQTMRLGGLQGIAFNGADGNKGIRIASMSGGVIRDLSFAYMNTSCINIEVIATDEANSVQSCLFENIICRLFDAADTGCHGFILNGLASPPGNASFNDFRAITVLHKNGDGIKLVDADNNTFYNIRTYRVAGTGYAMSFHGSNSSVGETARANFVDNLSCDSPVRFYGTGTYTYPSIHNHVILDNENGSTAPTIDAGAFNNSFAYRYAKNEFQQLAYAATITPNPYLGETINVGTLTGNVTIAAPTISSHIGKRMTLVFTQDGTGGRTFTFNAVFKKISTLSTVASKISTITFVYNGTSWIEVASGLGI